MANLLAAFDDSLRNAMHSRNVMLRLLDRQLGEESIAGFVANVAGEAQSIALPGYARGWCPAHGQPEWAKILDDNVMEGLYGFNLSPAAATLSSLRGFWLQGHFQGTAAGARGLRPWYRPCLPAIELTVEAFDALPFGRYVSSDVGFSADLYRRKQRFFATTVAFVASRIAQGSESLYLLYQDPAWFFLMGTDTTLTRALHSLRKRLSC